MPRPRKVSTLERPSASMRTNGFEQPQLRVRELSQEERASAYRGTFDTEPYIEFIQSMEPGKSYGIAADKDSARSTRVRLTRVAKSLGQRLRWAKVPDDSDELIVELFLSKR